MVGAPAEIKMNHRSAVLLLLVTAVLWSLGGVLIKSAEWPSLAKAGARSFLAAIILLAWIRRPAVTFSRVQILAAVAYTGTVSFFVVANDRTTAANAIFLQYTAPIYVALAGHWLLGEKVRSIDWICIAIALAGIALFFGDDFDSRGALGIAAALASGISFAVMVLCLRHEKDRSPATSLLLGNILTVLIAIPSAIEAGLPSAKTAGILTVLGIFQLGIPYVLYSISIQRVSALEAILIPMLEPILNPIWVALQKGEIPGRWSIVGALLVLGAVGFRSVFHVDEKPASSEK
jgi:drug/metabolite transporter (DMT)-like permease